MNGKLYNICLWICLLLLLQPAKGVKVCKQVKDRITRIHELNEQIVDLMDTAQGSKSSANDFRALAQNFTVDSKIQKLENDLNYNTSELLQKQLNAMKEQVTLLKSYSNNLKVVLKNKKEINEKLASENQKLRKEAEMLISEILQTPKKESAKTRTLQSYKTSPTWQRILLLAAKKGDLDEVTNLLNKGVDKNVRDDSPERLTPLLVAAKNGHVKVVQLLLDKGASLEETSFSLNTALHEAASAGHLEVCNLLLERNAKLEPYNTNNETPLQLAKKNGHQNVVDLFVKKGAKQSS